MLRVLKMMHLVSRNEKWTVLIRRRSTMGVAGMWPSQAGREPGSRGAGSGRSSWITSLTDETEHLNLPLFHLSFQLSRLFLSFFSGPRTFWGYDKSTFISGFVHTTKVSPSSLRTIDQRVRTPVWDATGWAPPCNIAAHNTAVLS